MKIVTNIGFCREKKMILFGCKLGRVLERPRAKFAGKKNGVFWMKLGRALERAACLVPISGDLIGVSESNINQWKLINTETD